MGSSEGARSYLLLLPPFLRSLFSIPMNWNNRDFSPFFFYSFSCWREDELDSGSFRPNPPNFVNALEVFPAEIFPLPLFSPLKVEAAFFLPRSTLLSPPSIDNIGSISPPSFLLLVADMAKRRRPSFSPLFFSGVAFLFFSLATRPVFLSFRSGCDARASFILFFLLMAVSFSPSRNAGPSDRSLFPSFPLFSPRRRRGSGAADLVLGFLPFFSFGEALLFPLSLPRGTSTISAPGCSPPLSSSTEKVPYSPLPPPSPSRLVSMNNIFFYPSPPPTNSARFHLQERQRL